LAEVIGSVLVDLPILRPENGLFRRSADPELTRVISNHKSISSFARYNKIDENHKASAMRVAFKNEG